MQLQSSSNPHSSHALHTAASSHCWLLPGWATDSCLTLLSLFPLQYLSVGLCLLQSACWNSGTTLVHLLLSENPCRTGKSSSLHLQHFIGNFCLFLAVILWGKSPCSHCRGEETETGCHVTAEDHVASDLQIQSFYSYPTCKVSQNCSCCSFDMQHTPPYTSGFLCACLHSPFLQNFSWVAILSCSLYTSQHLLTKFGS